MFKFTVWEDLKPNVEILNIVKGKIIGVNYRKVVVDKGFVTIFNLAKNSVKMIVFNKYLKKQKI